MLRFCGWFFVGCAVMFVLLLLWAWSAPLVLTHFYLKEVVRVTAKTRTLTVRYYGVDLYVTKESHKPELRKVLEVWSNSLPRSSELIQEVMLMYEIPFVARAEVEQLEGARAVASVTCRNVRCAL